MTTLTKHPSGRYYLDDAEFSCGDPIEILVGGHWIAGRMEHDGTDYYILIPDHDDGDRYTKLKPGGMRARRPTKGRRAEPDQSLKNWQQTTENIARLIAINDGLLKACEVAMTALQYHIGGNLSDASASEAITTIRAAIAKAKGQTP